MDLNSLLVTMGGANPLSAFGGGSPVPGFAGGMVSPQPMDFSAGINKALDENRKLAMQRQQQKQGGGLFGGGLRNFLGTLGDAFLVAGGAPPLHRQGREQQQLGQALSNYLGNVDPGLAEIIAKNPDVGLELYKMKNPAQGVEPETIRLLRAVGIDPQSEQGVAIITRKLEGAGDNKTAFLKEMEALGISGERAQRIWERKQTRPLVIGSAGTGHWVEDFDFDGGGSPSQVNSQEEYDALPPGAEYIDSQGNRGIKGGAAGGNSPLPFDRVMGALIRQESGGSGTAVSPAGALGSTQMLPATAKEMAGKIGLPFRPDLLKSNDPKALKYQRTLGEAYLREGLEKTGNLKDALRYYHGGPDRRQWGPKTNAYAASVLSILGAR